MIWAFEYLNSKQLQELKPLGPLMDFRYDFREGCYSWKTHCVGFEEIFDNPEAVLEPGKEMETINIPLSLIDCYPDEETCVDNVPDLFDSYDYIFEGITNGTYIPIGRTVRVTMVGRRYLTIDKSRVLAFKDAYALGYKEFSTIPVRFVKTLMKEIRRIRLFSIEQVKQGFICDDWEEAKELCMLLDGCENVEQNIEKEYRWIPDYLSLRKDNNWMTVPAVPVVIFLDHYSGDEEKFQMIEMNEFLAGSRNSLSDLSPKCDEGA
jgi:hypothetical protein